MKKLNVAVFGASGRMGQEIRLLMEQSKNFFPALGISPKGSAEGFFKTAQKLAAKDFKALDVLIDFSGADSFASVLQFAMENKIPLVSGTTGLSDKDKRALMATGKKIAILWAPNMSLGVATLQKALTALAALKNFDFQIEETHHRHKKDSPSGTALLLQDKLESVVGRKLPAPLSLRGGGVFGLHQVHVMGDNETLIFEHRALNRKLFAEGALVAARWIMGQKPGLYDMQDVLE